MRQRLGCFHWLLLLAIFIYLDVFLEVNWLTLLLTVAGLVIIIALVKHLYDRGLKGPHIIRKNAGNSIKVAETSVLPSTLPEKPLYLASRDSSKTSRLKKDSVKFQYESPVQLKGLDEDILFDLPVSEVVFLDNIYLEILQLIEKVKMNEDHEEEIYKAIRYDITQMSVKMENDIFIQSSPTKYLLFIFAKFSLDAKGIQELLQEGKHFKAITNNFIITLNSPLVHNYIGEIIGYEMLQPYGREYVLQLAELAKFLGTCDFAYSKKESTLVKYYDAYKL